VLRAFALPWFDWPGFALAFPLAFALPFFFPLAFALPLVAALATYKYKKSEGTKNTNVKGGCYRETQTR